MKKYTAPSSPARIANGVERILELDFGLRVIPGFREALQLMPAGSLWRLYIPAELGYGDKGSGATIPPGSTLIFDLEMVEFSIPKAATSPPIAVPVRP